jgi:hypothetical protein
MRLSNLVNKLYSKKGDYGNVVSVSTHYDYEIIENDQGQYFVDGVLIEAQLDDLEEVKRYIELQESASETKIKLYEDISDVKIASLIRKYNSDIKVTTNLVESYMSLASSKSFTTDPVLLEMRTSYKSANLIEGKIDFKLQDGKQVAISEETVNKLASLLNSTTDKEEILDYMRENIDNFLSVIRQL